MDRLLKTLAWVSLVVAIIVGVVESSRVSEAAKLAFGSEDQGFRWGIAISWWVSGILSAILLYAFGMMINYLEDISVRLHNLEYESSKSKDARMQPPSAPPKLGNSRANLNKLSGFQLGSSE